MRFRNNGQYYILEVPVGLAKSNGSLPPGGWLQVTCGLTACTPRAAPGPTIGNEYGGTLVGMDHILHGITVENI